jgi:hypothetical protein
MRRTFYGHVAQSPPTNLQFRLAEVSLGLLPSKPSVSPPVSSHADPWSYVLYVCVKFPDQCVGQTEVQQCRR